MSDPVTPATPNAPAAESHGQRRQRLSQLVKPFPATEVGSESSLFNRETKPADTAENGLG